MVKNEYPPILKINFLPDIEESGAKKGFIKIATTPSGGDEAKYNNEGRFVLASPDIIISNSGEQKTIDYTDYKNNPEKYSDTVVVKKYGIIGRLRLIDYDHGHEVTMFMSAETQNPKKLDWFADSIHKLIKKHAITEDNMNEHVFIIGKEPSKKGSMGRKFIRYLGTREDVELMEDPAGSSQARKENLLANQAPAPAAPEIQNFIMNPDEAYLMEQINQLLATKKVEVTVDRLRATFESGFNGKKTTSQRAAYIAAHAKELGYKGIISG